MKEGAEGMSGTSWDYGMPALAIASIIGVKTAPVLYSTVQ